jgi:hypothetical protein
MPKTDRRGSALACKATVIEAIRRLRGGAQSTLVRCDDEALYVLKLNGNPQGSNVLANEALGGHLLAGLGLQVPRCKNLTVTFGMLCRNPLLHFAYENGFAMPRSGLHFGSEFQHLPGHRLLEFLPEPLKFEVENASDFLGIYLFDVWASHQDRRQCIFRRNDLTRTHRVIFIDNGHLFGGPDWSKVAGRPRGACSGYVKPPSQRDLNIDKWISHFERLLPELLHEAVNEVPTEWYKGDIAALEQCLLMRLGNLKYLVNQEIEQYESFLARPLSVLNDEHAPLPGGGLLRYGNGACRNSAVPLLQGQQHSWQGYPALVHR